MVHLTGHEPFFCPQQEQIDLKLRLNLEHLKQEVLNRWKMGRSISFEQPLQYDVDGFFAKADLAYERILFIH